MSDLSGKAAIVGVAESDALGRDSGKSSLQHHAEASYNALADADESSFIKVENIDAPIILISGKYDQIWPSEKMCNQIIDRLEKNNFKYDFEHIALDTDHFLFSSNKEIIDIIDAKLRDFFN